MNLMNSKRTIDFLESLLFVTPMDFISKWIFRHKLKANLSAEFLIVLELRFQDHTLLDLDVFCKKIFFFDLKIKKLKYFIEFWVPPSYTPEPGSLRDWNLYKSFFRPPLNWEENNTWWKRPFFTRIFFIRPDLVEKVSESRKLWFCSR